MKLLQPKDACEWFACFYTSRTSKVVTVKHIKSKYQNHRKPLPMLNSGHQVYPPTNSELSKSKLRKSTSILSRHVELCYVNLSKRLETELEPCLNNSLRPFYTVFWPIESYPRADKTRTVLYFTQQSYPAVYWLVD